MSKWDRLYEKLDLFVTVRYLDVLATHYDIDIHLLL